VANHAELHVTYMQSYINNISLFIECELHVNLALYGTAKNLQAMTDFKNICLLSIQLDVQDKNVFTPAPPNKCRSAFTVKMLRDKNNNNILWPKNPCKPWESYKHI